MPTDDTIMPHEIQNEKLQCSLMLPYYNTEMRHTVPQYEIKINTNQTQ